MNTNDIYHIVGVYLMYQGYDDVREVPIEALKEQIKNYILYKIQYFGSDLDLMGALTKLETMVSEEEKSQAMGNFIHYLLGYLSLLQGFEMVWYIDNDIEEPIFKKSDYNSDKYDGLVTSKKINYIKTFKFVLDEIEKKLESELNRK